MTDAKIHCFLLLTSLFFHFYFSGFLAEIPSEASAVFFPSLLFPSNNNLPTKTQLLQKCTKLWIRCRSANKEKFPSFPRQFTSSFDPASQICVVGSPVIFLSRSRDADALLGRTNQIQKKTVSTVCILRLLLDVLRLVNENDEWKLVSRAAHQICAPLALFLWTRQGCKDDDDGQKCAVFSVLIHGQMRRIRKKIESRLFWQGFWALLMVGHAQTQIQAQRLFPRPADAAAAAQVPEGSLVSQSFKRTSGRCFSRSVRTIPPELLGTLGL